MTVEPTQGVRERAPSITGVIIAALLAVAVCGWLGVWQWDRAHTRAIVVLGEAPSPIGAIIAPSSDASAAIGRSVRVTGTWGDDAVLVRGREVDGVSSVLLVRSLIVPADQTGTGAEARIAVLVGHRPSGDVACGDTGADAGPVTVTGYIRGSEPPPLATSAAPNGAACAMRETTALSVAEFAQTWTGPLYSAMLVSEGGAGDWAAMPPRDPGTRLNLQSLLYAAEWWCFGLFAVVLAFRWVRENGRDRAGEFKGATDE